jgi:hypothetical protein
MRSSSSSSESALGSVPILFSSWRRDFLVWHTRLLAEVIPDYTFTDQTESHRTRRGYAPNRIRQLPMQSSGQIPAIIGLAFATESLMFHVAWTPRRFLPTVTKSCRTRFRLEPVAPKNSAARIGPSCSGCRKSFSKTVVAI